MDLGLHSPEQNRTMNSQLALWRGEFGRAYIERNDAAPDTIRRVTAMWARMLQNIQPYEILEVGANVGINLRALRNLTSADLTAVEPNDLARQRLKNDGFHAVEATAQRLPFNPDRFDLVFTCGVLIHIHPDDLPEAMDEIVRVSRKYILCAEYYAAQPREVEYRGRAGQMFLRDYGEEYARRARILDYGFFWPEGLNWWLFEKQ